MQQLHQLTKMQQLHQLTKAEETKAEETKAEETTQIKAGQKSPLFCFSSV
jgi:hypothetical protein